MTSPGVYGKELVEELEDGANEGSRAGSTGSSTGSTVMVKEDESDSGKRSSIVGKERDNGRQPLSKDWVQL
jgi:hypothetical protein